MANAAGFDLDEHFARAGFGPRYGFYRKSCSDLAEYGGFHGLAQDCSSLQLGGKAFRCGHLPGLKRQMVRPSVQFSVTAMKNYKSA